MEERAQFQSRIRQHMNRDKINYRLRIIKYNLLSSSDKARFYDINKNIKKYDLFDWNLVDGDPKLENSTQTCNSRSGHHIILRTIPEYMDKCTQKNSSGSSSSDSSEERESDNDIFLDREKIIDMND